MDENETTNEQAQAQPVVMAVNAPPVVIEPQVDAFGLPPLVAERIALDDQHFSGVAQVTLTPEEEATLARPGNIVFQPFTAALHPDDAIARCTEILDNMHGSDDQRRKVVQALVERFAP